MHTDFFFKEGKGGGVKGEMMMVLTVVATALRVALGVHSGIQSNLLAAHELTGCDTSYGNWQVCSNSQVMHIPLVTWKAIACHWQMSSTRHTIHLHALDCLSVTL